MTHKGIQLLCFWLAALSVAALVGCNRSKQSVISGVPSPVQAHAEAVLVYSVSAGNTKMASVWVFRGPSTLGSQIVQDNAIKLDRVHEYVEQDMCNSFAGGYLKTFGVTINCEEAKVWRCDVRSPQYTIVRVIQSPNETWLLIIYPDS